MIKKFLLLMVLIVLCSCGGVDQKKRHLIKDATDKSYVEYGNWLLAKENGECFITSFPISSSGSFLNRELNYIILDFNRATKKIELGVIGGGKYKTDSFVRLQIEDTSFFLSIVKDQAWAVNEDAIIPKLLSSSELAFLLFSNFNEEDVKVIDKYSLEGFSDAYNELKIGCNSLPQSAGSDIVL